MSISVSEDEALVTEKEKIVSVVVTLLTTICKGFDLLTGAGLEFLLHAIKKQQLIKIAYNLVFIYVTFSISYVTILVLVLP